MLGAFGITPTVAFESDERSSWTPAVLAGIGYCIWYRAQGEAAAAQGAKVVALDRPLGRSIGVIHRPDVRAPGSGPSSTSPGPGGGASPLSAAPG